MMVSAILLVCLLSSSQGFKIHVTDDAKAVTPVARNPRGGLGDPQSDLYIDFVLITLQQMILDNNMDPMSLDDQVLGAIGFEASVRLHPTNNCTDESDEFYPSCVADQRPAVGAVHHLQDGRHQPRADGHRAQDNRWSLDICLYLESYRR